MSHVKSPPLLGKMIIVAATFVTLLTIGHLMQQNKSLQAPPPNHTNASAGKVTKEGPKASHLARENENPKGEISETISSMWVTIENSRPIWNGNHRYSQGDTCLTRESERAIIIKVEGDRVLLRYAPRREAGGSNCPNEALFYVSTEKAATTSD